MLVTAMSLKAMLSTIALMAMLAVVFGSVMRRVGNALLAQALLGALFGGAAVLAVHDPLQVAPGIIVDLRGVPVALAGGFLGWPGALVAGSLAAVMRLQAGGAAAFAGVVGIAVAAGAGLAWARLNRGRDAGDRRGTTALAALSSLYVLSIFLLPWDVAWPALAAVGPVLVPLHFVGVLAVGGLLERERRIVAEGLRLALEAGRDPLTGLLNRRGFEAAVLGAPDSSWGSAVLALDLDHFKRVNDAYGHAAGDAVLRALGPRLHEALGAEARIARFGGEEVVAFVPALGPNVARHLARRLVSAVRAEPFALPCGTRIAVTASVGGAWDEAPVLVDELMARADAALYEAKQGGAQRLAARRRGRQGPAPPRGAPGRRLSPGSEHAAPPVVPRPARQPPLPSPSRQSQPAMWCRNLRTLRPSSTASSKR
jgi:diguanylate cyclase